MDFSLSDEQRLLRDSVDRFVAERYAFSKRQKLVYASPGFSEENWRLFAEMG